MLYCGSNIRETPERRRRRNLGSSAKRHQTAGESCRCRYPKLSRSFTDIPHIHSCLILSHCVNSSNLLCSRSPSARRTETHQTSLRSAYSQKGILFPLFFLFFFFFGVIFAGLGQTLSQNEMARGGDNEDINRTRQRQPSGNIKIDLSSFAVSPLLHSEW